MNAFLVVTMIYMLIVWLTHASIKSYKKEKTTRIEKWVSILWPLSFIAFVVTTIINFLKNLFVEEN